jgi:hypothetical protein
VNWGREPDGRRLSTAGIRKLPMQMRQRLALLVQPGKDRASMPVWWMTPHIGRGSTAVMVVARGRVATMRTESRAPPLQSHRTPRQRQSTPPGRSVGSRRLAVPHRKYCNVRRTKGRQVATNGRARAEIRLHEARRWVCRNGLTAALTWSRRFCCRGRRIRGWGPFQATHVFTRWPNASTYECHAGGIRRGPVDIA